MGSLKIKLKQAAYWVLTNVIIPVVIAVILTTGSIIIKTILERYGYL